MAVSAVVIVAWAAGVFEPTERVTYDQRCRWSADPSKADSRIVCVYIDEPSIARLKEDGETWPWHREYYAGLVDFCHRGGAKVVVFDTLFLDPSHYGAEDDRMLGEAMKKAGNVVVALAFTSKPRTPPVPLPSRAGGPSDRSLDLPEAVGLDPLIPEIADNAAGFGDVVFAPDGDGVLRSTRLFVRYRDRIVPALGLEAIHVSRDPMPAFPRLDLRPLGHASPSASDTEIHVKFHGGPGTYRTYSIADLFASEQAVREGTQPPVDPESLRGKYVVVGMSAAGLYDLRSTPVAAKSPGAEIHAALIDNLLNGESIRRVPTAFTVVLIMGLALAVGVAGSLLSVGGGFAVNALIGIGYAFVAAWAFGAHDLWLDAVAPEAAVVLGMIGSATVNYALEGREKRKIHGIFGKFVSPYVVNELIRHPERVRLGGELREVTVFFSDIAGFTTVSEVLTPENVVPLMNEYLSAMSDLIIERGGTLDKYIGDAIMAFWGAPLAQSDHAIRACEAALDNIQELSKIQDTFRSRGLPYITSRIGLNSGRAVVGLVGSGHIMNYTAMGDAVNLASRLEGANKEFGTQIMISEATRVAAGEAIEVRELDLIAVKGKRQAVRVYELLAQKGGVSPERRALVQAYEQGLVAYRARDWQRALAAFERALTLDPKDGPSQVYRTRCQMYLKDPPPTDWDGVFVMKSK